MGDRVVGLRRRKKILYVSELAEGTPRACGDESAARDGRGRISMYSPRVWG